MRTYRRRMASYLVARVLVALVAYASVAVSIVSSR